MQSEYVRRALKQGGAHSELAAALSYSAHGEPVRRDPRSSRKARPTTAVLSFLGDAHLMTGRMDRTIADHTMNAARRRDIGLRATRRGFTHLQLRGRRYRLSIKPHSFDELERDAPHQYYQFWYIHQPTGPIDARGTRPTHSSTSRPRGLGCLLCGEHMRRGHSRGHLLWHDHPPTTRARSYGISRR